MHEDAIHDFQLVDVAALELLEAVLLEVAGAALTSKAAGAAVEVEVVVLAQVAVHGCAVQSACNVLADAQAILVNEAVLLAGDSTTKPAAPLLYTNCLVQQQSLCLAVHSLQPSLSATSDIACMQDHAVPMHTCCLPEGVTSACRGTAEHCTRPLSTLLWQHRMLVWLDSNGPGTLRYIFVMTQIKHVHLRLAWRSSPTGARVKLMVYSIAHMMLSCPCRR